MQYDLPRYPINDSYVAITAKIVSLMKLDHTADPLVTLCSVVTVILSMVNQLRMS